ncbi:MAG: M42 family metallopeptidase [Gaiellales bacterium]
MSDRIFDLLARLDAAVGVSGHEGDVAEVIADELDGTYDSRDADPLGNQYFTRTGEDGAPTVMLCAHMDELGFVIRHIEDEGFLRIGPIGGHDSRMVIDQDIAVHGIDGPVHGITGAKPAHLVEAEERKQAIPMEELFVDVGTDSREATEKLGVRVGQVATFLREGTVLNGSRVFSGKAVDDRAGCAVMVEVMRRLADHKVSATVCATASVQEEVGLRGAEVAGTRVQPDVALALDVCVCGDTPGVEFRRSPITLGGGPAIKYYDAAGWTGAPVPRHLTQRLEQAAEGAGIEYQREVLFGGGTDAWAIAVSGGGVLSGCVSVPSRYIHSAVGCVNLDDIEGTARLVLAFLEDVSANGLP